MATNVKHANFSGMVMECAQILFNKRSRKPSAYGWVCIGLLILIFVNLVFYHNKGPSGINPKFKETVAAEMEAVDIEVNDPLRPREHKLVHGGVLKLPAFDPNREQPHQLSPQHQKQLKKYGMPKPKDFPVDVLQTPRLACEGDLLLFTLVESSPESQVARNKSRHTWGRQDKSGLGIDQQKWLTIYVMGKPRDTTRMKLSIREESEKYGDILQGDFLDSPYEGTRKFMLATTWLVGYIQSGNLHDRNAAKCLPRFVLKTQGNIYHNMLSITGWLEHKFDITERDLYVGHLLRQDVPVRDYNNPMYVPAEDYALDTFPDMIREPIYLFSYDAFVAMEASLGLVTPIAMQDAYIGLLAENIGVEPRDNDHFHLLKIADRGDICHLVNHFFFFDVTSGEHERIADRLRKCRATETKKMPAPDHNPRKKNGN